MKKNKYHFKRTLPIVKQLNDCDKGQYIYIGRGSPYGNPFVLKDESQRDSVINQYETWLKTQPEILDFTYRYLPGQNLGCYCSPKPCHGDVLVKAIESWEFKKRIHVFGSNLAGRHGAGAAKSAKHWYGAEYGNGMDLQGNSYAIPTKDEQLRILDLSEIKKYVDRFIEYAKSTPENYYTVTPIGTGLSGYEHKEIAPMFESIPDNIEIPAIWQKIINNNDTLRIIIAGGRDFDDYSLVKEKMDRLLSESSYPIQIIHGNAKGADVFGEKYALSRGINFRRMPADWEQFNKSAGTERNWRMANCATHLVAFWDGKSHGTKQMIQAGQSYGLITRIIKYGKKGKRQMDLF